MSTIKIAPSILAADYGALGEAVRMIEQAGADIVHFDVMDGNFVPNISFGPDMLRALRRYTELPFDAHLMVERPADFIDAFIDAGASIITFHTEAEKHPQRQLERIRKAGVKAGLVLNPGTPVAALECLLDYCDMILLMSVNPGFGGQRFLPYTINKLRELREACNLRALDMDIEVDGGINEITAAQCRQAGANVLVAGNYVFASEDVSAAVRRLRG